MQKYGEFVKGLAEKEKLHVADLNSPVVENLKRAKEINAELAGKLIPDYVHPAASGQLLMAAELLKAWNAPALVSAVEIDAAGGKATKSANAEVSNISKTADSLKWDQLDKALPMPVDMNDPVMALAVNSSDLVEKLNQQTLKVSGLTADHYVLSIDGAEAGKFSREDLAKGVNLAMLNTPMKKQASEVHKLTLAHNNLHFLRWRNVQVPYASEKLPHLEQALSGLDSMEHDLVNKQREAAKPKKHAFVLKAA